MDARGRYVSGSMRSTRDVYAMPARPGFVRVPVPTQREPLPNARSVGRPPVAKVFTIRRVFWSMREIVRSSAFSTQTLPSPTTTLLGVVPVAV